MSLRLDAGQHGKKQLTEGEFAKVIEDFVPPPPKAVKAPKAKKAPAAAFK